MRRILIGADVALVMLMCFGFGSLSYVGYRGYDDFHYVYAALSLLETGEPVVTDHWSIRFPHVLALFVSLKVFGVSEWAVTLPSIGGYVCSALLTYLGVRHFWGRTYGLVAALVFAGTPLFAVLANVPFVMFTQLLLITLGFWLLIWANESNKLWLNMVAGIPIGLAVLAHLTSAAVILSTTVITLLIYKNWKAWLLCAVGAAAIGVADISYFSATQGEPFYRVKLTSNHSQITKHAFGYEDKSGVQAQALVQDLKPVGSKNFFKFVTDSKRFWEHVPINVHWSVNPFLSFLLHYDLAVNTLALIAVLLICRFASLPKLSEPQRRVLLALGIAAVTWFVCANYLFSLRPQTRYFGPVMYCISVALAIGLMHLWHSGTQRLRGLVIVMALGIVTANALLIDMRESNHTEHRHLAQYMSINDDSRIVVAPRFLERRLPEVYQLDQKRLLQATQADRQSLWLVTQQYPQHLPFTEQCNVWQSASRVTIIGKLLILLNAEQLLPEHIRMKLIRPQQTIRLVQRCDNTMEVSR